MKIVEIFRSLQGEGKNQGKPCLFIRLAGCNLKCRWCDTPASRSSGIEMSLDTVMEQVWRINPPYVCVTGGEPLLQADELERLLVSMKKRGTAIDIETNGTIDFSRFQPCASICMDVKCPSSGEQSDLSLLEKIRPEDSVKFVVKDEADCRYAQEVLKTHPISGEVFLSPVFGADYQPLVRFVLTNTLPVRFQLQLHKILGVQ
ncbi:radical SAM protein [Methanoregula sp.]|uniref:7-carboxy-7-deazaguanine synthase QueE n=1 Tax=Methanoregula sp. TaxID=2052170 RepID=UPI00236B1DD1|nr:radical SAM protein [Methanoregula sp.]MDD1687646.1 radical SAM protein [Methanoregula sp.]